MGIGDGSLGRAVFQGSPGGFSRQLQGEKGRLLFTDLPARFYSPRMPSYTRSFLLHSHLSARSATTRHMDAHEERLLRRTRKRPRESSSRFASLVKWTRDFAYRTASRLLRSLLRTLSLCPPRSFPLSRYPTCYPSHLFSSFGGRALLVWDVPNERIPLERNWNTSFIRKQILIHFTRSETKKKQNKFYDSKAEFFRTNFVTVDSPSCQERWPAASFGNALFTYVQSLLRLYCDQALRVVRHHPHASH